MRGSRAWRLAPERVKLKEPTSLAATTQIAVGRVFPEPLSRLGRAIADGTLYLTFDRREVAASMGKKRLEKFKRDAELLLDELTWDIDALSDPEKIDRILESISVVKEYLSLLEERLRRWERIGSREKVTHLHLS